MTRKLSDEQLLIDVYRRPKLRRKIRKRASEAQTEPLESICVDVEIKVVHAIATGGRLDLRRPRHGTSESLVVIERDVAAVIGEQEKALGTLLTKIATRLPEEVPADPPSVRRGVHDKKLHDGRTLSRTRRGKVFRQATLLVDDVGVLCDLAREVRAAVRQAHEPAMPSAPGGCVFGNAVKLGQEHRPHELIIELGDERMSRLGKVARELDATGELTGLGDKLRAPEPVEQSGDGIEVRRFKRTVGYAALHLTHVLS